MSRSGRRRRGPGIFLVVATLLSAGGASALVDADGAVPAAAQAQRDRVPGEGPDAGRTVVYRDGWGVPHIYAPTVEAGLYAMGWAQAEDRPEQLLLNLAMARGELSRVAGPDAVESDLRARAWDHYGTARRGYERLPPRVRSHLEAFVRGIRAFYAEHPEDLPGWWEGREVAPYMIVAWARAFLYEWSIDEVFDDLRRGGVDAGLGRTPRASNQFAVAPSRSATGAAILAIDPHLSWWGPSRFWEVRIHAGELHGSGVTLPGFPYVGLGHNRDLAWAMTTGGPDTADVYRLQLDPDDPDRYLYDGEWRSLRRRPVRLDVRRRVDGEEVVQGEMHTLHYSHHGPVLARRGDVAWAGRISYDDVVEINVAWHELAFATDYTGAVRAMDTLAMFPQNVMVADTSGNIYYQRTGRTPRRPAGHDWSAPVDGSTSATEWLGFHPASDHLQVLNPPQGYMQNCNVPPDAMMPESPFRPDGGAPEYLYGSRAYGPLSGWSNQRGARAIELLAADDSVTARAAMDYITDVRPYGVERWLEALRRADARFGRRHAGRRGYSAALRALTGWDGELRRDSAAALLYARWRTRLVEELGSNGAAAIAAEIDAFYEVAVLGKTPHTQLDESGQRALVAALAAVAADTGWTERRSGPSGAGAAATDVRAPLVWGDVHRVGRGEASWPVGGGGGGSGPGTTTLRVVNYGPPRADGTRWGTGGQTATQVVVLGEPVRSWTYLPVGQSDRPGSAHYADQAERLFSPRRLKPSRWLPEELVGHVDSRRVLEDAG